MGPLQLIPLPRAGEEKKFKQPYLYSETATKAGKRDHIGTRSRTKN